VNVCPHRGVGSDGGGEPSAWMPELSRGFLTRETERVHFILAAHRAGLSYPSLRCVNPRRPPAQASGGALHRRSRCKSLSAACVLAFAG
jgi:hypothetical protein